MCSLISLCPLSSPFSNNSSGELIGCVAVDISIQDLNDSMKYSVIDKHSELLMVDFDTGVLVSDSAASNSQSEEIPVHVSEFSVVTKDHLQVFQSAVNFANVWHPETAEEAFRLVQRCDDGGLVTAYPVPVIPDQYDPSYRPKFLVIHTITTGVFEAVDRIHNSIDQDVVKVCVLSAGLAVFAFIVVMSIVWLVSRMLTKPLLWMEKVTWRIVNHSDERFADASLSELVEEEKNTKRWFIPRTEVYDLVDEFRLMIKGFR